MAKAKNIVFFCRNCGYESPKWMGQCPGCKEWNTFVEEPKASSDNSAGRPQRSKAAAKPVCLSSVEGKDEERTATGIKELDRVLGGGIVPGSLVLVGGDPGIGKSTLLLQVFRLLAEQGMEVLYVSGEESLRQIKMRAGRIGRFSDNMKVLCETDLQAVCGVIEKMEPEAVVIDSIQTMNNDDISSPPGSVSQIRESTSVLMRLAKSSGIPIFIVGHVTKEGTVAGPRVLEHMVDTVLYFEGDRHASYRILRAVKNRFGSTDEIGVFEMRESGLAEVENPSEFMLSGRLAEASGSMVSCSVEGSRPILVEIQALVARSTLAVPRRTAAGMDYNRVNLLLAVLEKRMNLRLSASDVYVNIAGGLRVGEPAVDLGVVLAVVSSALDVPTDAKMLAFGEVGLGGEVRAVSQAEKRVREAAKLGFETVVLPESCRRQISGVCGIKLIGVRTVPDAVKIIR